MFDFFKNVIIYAGLPGVLIILFYLFVKIFITKDIVSQLSEQNTFKIVLVFIFLFSFLIFLVFYGNGSNNNKQICTKIKSKINIKIKQIDSCADKINVILKKSNNTTIKRHLFEVDSALLVICKEKLNGYLTLECDSLLTHSIELNLNDCDEILNNY